MIPQHSLSLPEPLYQRLKTMAERQGQTVEAFVTETLEEVADEPADMDMSFLAPLPDPDLLLPPHGSPEEEALRDELGKVLSRGPSLGQWLREERDQR